MAEHSADERPTVELAGSGLDVSGGEPSEQIGIESEVALARVRSRLRGSTETPVTVGRYRIVERLGRGGMGVVYAARDDELERIVAIKILHADMARSEDGRRRMLREAQAMAKLSHPNVGHVYEVGRHGEQVFLAMELVRGVTLRQWCNAPERTWRDILRVHVAAGEGLAAAHAVGLVHRDYKCENVLVGDDGRPRVLDFGLARPDALHSGPTEATDGGERASASGSAEITRAGTVVGTPAYMAPEQLAGDIVDARADQFSFCVALFEGLFGKRPFHGATLPDLASAVVAGRLREVPSDAGVPRFVVAALRRGLAREPDDRFPTMTDLLAALRRDPARRWRRLALVGGVAGLASAIGFAAARRDESGCDEVGERLVGVWDDEARPRVRAAILATEAPFAERSWQTVEGLLDAYAARWRELATQSCASTRVATADDRELAARRGRCLDARLAELDGLVDLLAEADAAMALVAVDAATRLPDLGGCSDSHRLAAWHDAADPAVRERLQQARTRLAQAGADGALGRYKPAIAIAQEVVDVATELQDPALEAAALLVRGQNEERQGDAKQAEATLRRATEQAEQVNDHGTRAQALIHLVFVVGEDRRYDEAQALAADAGAVLRVIAADPLLRAQLDINLGVAAKRAGDLDAALGHYQRALAALEELFGAAHPSTLRVVVNTGNLLRQQAAVDLRQTAGPAGELRSRMRYVEAEAYLRRAATGLELVLGGDHPLVAVTLSNLAITLALQERSTAAIPVFRRSLEIRQRNDPDHPEVATAHYNLARALYQTRAYADALAHYERGLAIRTKTGGEERVLVDFHEGVGQSAARAGQRERAREALAIALAFHEKGDDAAELARVRTELALASVETDPARTLALAKQVQGWLDSRPAGAVSNADQRLRDELAVAATIAESRNLLTSLSR